MNANEQDIFNQRQEANKIMQDAIKKNKEADKRLEDIAKRENQAASTVETANAQARSIIAGAQAEADRFLDTKAAWEKEKKNIEIELKAKEETNKALLEEVIDGVHHIKTREKNLEKQFQALEDYKITLEEKAKINEATLKSIQEANAALDYEKEVLKENIQALESKRQELLNKSVKVENVLRETEYIKEETNKVLQEKQNDLNTIKLLRIEAEKLKQDALVEKEYLKKYRADIDNDKANIQKAIAQIAIDKAEIKKKLRALQNAKGGSK